MYIYLNPQYVIRNENNCSYIIAKSALITAKLEYAMAFASVVPPSIGYILSHIGEGELNASIENIANTLNIKPDLIDKFIRKIIDNPVKVGWNYKGVTISFPPYLLTSVKEESEGSVYTDNELGGNLALTGGDIFAFPDWKEVIRKVGQYGFTPLLSTKIPLKEDDIYFLKESGIKFLQFSLDSIFTSTLQTMVRVKEDYIDNVKQMFEYS